MRRLRRACRRHRRQVLHLLALQCEGAKVTTIEGLAEPNGPLHPMQEAFREHHGLQCGYCTPGMIMAALDIVRRKGNDLDEHTIREQLDGNICRCTGYHNIVKAIAAGAQSDGQRRRVAASGRITSVANDKNIPREETAMSATGIGAAVRRKEDFRFITGQGQYTDDVVRPGETRAVFVRSPHARAKIKSIDASAAKKMPGVVAVLTGADLATDKIGNLICGWMIHSKDGSPMKMAPHPALATGKVNHVGDAVAVVIAETAAQARDAAEKVEGRLRGAAGGDRSGQGAGAGAPQIHADIAEEHDLPVAPRRRQGDRRRRSPRPSTSPSSTSSTTGWCRMRSSRARRSPNTMPAPTTSRCGIPRRTRTWRGSSSPPSSAWRRSTNCG